MEKDENRLDRPATEADIFDLYRAGFLSPEARDSALHFLRPPLRWWEWVKRLLLFLGAALVLAGVVFFFAFNWAKMGKFLKFALVEGGILLSVLGAWKAGLERIPGKLLLLGASLLVGVFLAVFGQVYQTGADAYEFFLGWWLLILVWVFISKFVALWLMWLTLINLALAFYWFQVLLPNGSVETAALPVLLASINGSALVLYEYGRRRKRGWLSPRWPRWVLVLSILAYLTIPGLVFIVDDRHREAMGGLALLLLAVFWAALYRYFRFVGRDLFSLTLGALSLCAVVLTSIGRLLFENAEGPGVVLVFSLVVAGVFSLVTYWLRTVHKTMNGEEG